MKRLLAPQRLTDCIAQHLPLGTATLVRATPRPIDAPGYLSDLVGVTLDWRGESRLPVNAVLKMSHPGFGSEELPFYASLARWLDCALTARFYAGGVDEPTGRTWLLLEDLSASHERLRSLPMPSAVERMFAQVGDALDGRTRALCSQWLEGSPPSSNASRN